MKYLLPFFFLILYLLLPTHNSTVDAYFYAGAVKYQEYLFLPHHLLYNALGWLWVRCLNVFGLQADVLPALKALNAVVAAGSLGVLYKILRQINAEKPEALGWVAFTGCSFGTWRFATENEAYILPVFFSLLASYFFIRFSHTQKSKFIVVSGLLAAIACLFHQIHIFWWIGLLIGSYFIRKKPRDTIRIALPALLIPLVYTLVLFFDQNQAITLKNLLNFALHDVQAGRVQTRISLQNFILTPVNVIRTWLQVHGNMLFLIKRSMLYILPALASLTLFFYLISQKRFINTRSSDSVRHTFFLVHVLIFLLQLGFAFYAVGNSEFMVMLPSLLAILITSKVKLPIKVLAPAALALFIWNISYGIFPNYFYRFSHQQAVIRHLQQYPNALFISSDDAQLLNELYYSSGREEHQKVVRSPSIMALKGIPQDSLHQLIKTYQQQHEKVFTDCLQKPKVQNRASMVIEDVDSIFFASYTTTMFDTSSTFYGNRYIFEVR